VNSFTRGLSVALFSVGLMLSAAGCGVDNETEAEKLAKGMGDPGPVSAKDKDAPKPSGPPATQAEAGKRALESQTQGKKGSSYPGAKK
jgi:hypothetical protein